MNVFWHEIRSYRRSTIIWIISLSLMVILFLSLFPLFTKDIDSTKKLLDTLPAAVRTGLGISLQSFFTIFGFFGYLFTYVLLAGAIQAMGLGVGILSREDSGKTADFLLTKPISRARIVSAKLFASISLLVLTNIIFTASAFIMALAVSKASFDALTFLLIAASLFLVQLFFLSLGVALSVILSKVKSVIAVTLPVVFGFFIVGTLGSVLGNDSVKLFSPFKFYDTQYIISHRSYELKFMVIEIVCIIVAITVTYLLYLKKDIRAAS